MITTDCLWIYAVCAKYIRSVKIWQISLSYLCIMFYPGTPSLFCCSSWGFFHFFLLKVFLGGDRGHHCAAKVTHNIMWCYFVFIWFCNIYLFVFLLMWRTLNCHYVWKRIRDTRFFDTSWLNSWHSPILFPFLKTVNRLTVTPGQWSRFYRGADAWRDLKLCWHVWIRVAEIKCRMCVGAVCFGINDYPYKLQTSV